MIQNKVAESELITLDLKTFLPKDQPLIFDIKDFLFQGLILKEKEFRIALTTHNWDTYVNKTVLICCSADAIVPVWAYMLVMVHLHKVASEIFFEHEANWRERRLLDAIASIDITKYAQKRIVIKGCGEEHIPEAAFVLVTQKLIPVVKSLMYGEPCSTVPIYKMK